MRKSKHTPLTDEEKAKICADLYELSHRVGGNAILCEAVGMTESCFYRWTQGKKPLTRSRLLLNELAKRYGMLPIYNDPLVQKQRKSIRRRGLV